MPVRRGAGADLSESTYQVCCSEPRDINCTALAAKLDTGTSTVLQSQLRMPGGAVAGELGKLKQKTQGLTPFEKEVADATRRRDANKKREHALALRQSVTVRHRRSAARGFSACAAAKFAEKALLRYALSQIWARHHVCHELATTQATTFS